MAKRISLIHKENFRLINEYKLRSEQIIPVKECYKENIGLSEVTIDCIHPIYGWITLKETEQLPHRVRDLLSYLDVGEDPLEQMKDDITIYDNGEKSMDRYTVIMPDKSVYAMSKNAMSPIGVNIYIGEREDFPEDLSHLGKEIELKDIPYGVKRAIIMRID